MNYIDGDDDHVCRTIKIEHVFNMVEEARTNSDGTKVQKPTFTSCSLVEKYEYCLCGHDIKYNYTATCDQTGKSFIVGSECIQTVCKEKSYPLHRKCEICIEEPASSKSSNFCKMCRKMVTACNKPYTMGKYKGLPYCNLPQSHKNWVKSENPSNKKLADYKDWVIYAEKYPKILTYPK
jgi:hypothetical protein